jgi:uncharacterized protein (TIGR02145 family)
VFPGVWIGKQKREGEMTMKKLTALLALLCAAAFAQETFTDPRDNKTYKTTKIGTQTWMAENLNFNANGSKCSNNKPANCERYGRLYDWNTAKTACPKGWHLPSDYEKDILVDFAGGYEIAGTKLKSKNRWNKNGNGEDAFGFSALPGGNGDSDGGFKNVGNYGLWWSASEDTANKAYLWLMYYGDERVSRDLYYKSFLFSVRCLQD